MIVRNMRWGYDGGEMACGPVEGSTIVEIIVTHEKHNYFVCASRMSEFMKITVSPVSVYDILMESNRSGVDWEFEFDKFQKLVTEEYDFAVIQMDDAIQKMCKSDFINAFKLVCMAMKEAYQPEDPTYEGAAKFINEYVSKNLTSNMLQNFQEIFADEISEYFEDEYDEEEDDE